MGVRVGDADGISSLFPAGVPEPTACGVPGKEVDASKVIPTPVLKTHGSWVKHPFLAESTLLPVLSALKSAFSSRHFVWIQMLLGCFSDSS